MHEGFAFIYFQSQYDTALFFLFRTYLCNACMRRPGGFPGAWRLWQVVSLHLILDLCPLHSLLNYFLVIERSGRKPPAEPSALYVLTYMFVLELLRMFQAVDFSMDWRKTIFINAEWDHHHANDGIPRIVYIDST